MAALGNVSTTVKSVPINYALTLTPPGPPPAIPGVGQIFPYVAPAS